MRILGYSINYFPEPTGIAPIFSSLCNSLKKKGHDLTVVTGFPHYPNRIISSEYRGKLFLTEYINGVKVLRSYVAVFPEKNGFQKILHHLSFSFSSMIRLFLDKGNYDVVFWISPPLSSALPVYLFSLLKRCPIVICVQDILPDAAVNFGLIKNKFIIWVMRKLEWFAYRGAKKVIVISNGFSENLIQKGVPREKLEVIYNWVDTNHIRPLEKENSFKEKFNLKNKFIVLYAGNIGYSQGLEVVIDAANLVKEYLEIVFLLVGNGTTRDDLFNYAKKIFLTNIRFLPVQPQDMLPKMLASADVSLVVQKGNNLDFNMPSKIPGIMASGRPLIAAVNIQGDAARIVKESCAGILVDPGNSFALAKAVLELKKNYKKGEMMGFAGRAYAEKYFSMDQAISKYEKIFLEIMNSY